MAKMTNAELRKAIVEFFDDLAHQLARIWIADANIQSQRVFLAAGFTHGGRHDLGELPQDKGSHCCKGSFSI